MANFANYVALVCKCFEDDSVLPGMVDDEIIAGFQRTNADSHLEGAHQTCIGVRSLDIIAEDLGGCAYHGLSMYDQLIEISVTAKADDDTYIASVVHEIMRIMKRPLTKTLNGVSYSISTIGGGGKFKPVNDPAFSDRIEMTGTYRLGFIDD